MLNPELVKYYGEECKPFFEGFVKSVNEEILDKCYAIKGVKTISGKLCAPRNIGVIAEYETVYYVSTQCLDLLGELKDKDEEEEIWILAVGRTLDSVEKDGIKIWV